MAYPAATQPTLYFIGVTTGKSRSRGVFPSWARHFELADAVIKGMDFPLDADPAGYREAVSFIKADPLSRGALVTTHKIDLFRACRDLFDAIDPHAALDGRDELPVQARRPAGLPRQGPDLLRAGARRLPAGRGIRPHRRRGLRDGRRRLDDRASPGT